MSEEKTDNKVLSNSNPEEAFRKKTSNAEEVSSQAERDEKRSFYCNLIGNGVVFLLLIAYIVYAFYVYATPALNQKTTFGIQLTNTLTFPTIFFQLAEFGTLEYVSIVTANESCKIQEVSNPIIQYLDEIYNPKSSKDIDTSTDWVLVNTSFSFYNYSSGYNFSSFTPTTTNSTSSNRRRQLLSSLNSTNDSYYGGNYDYSNFGYYYFANYSLQNYFNSSSSNIFYIFPPSSPTEYFFNTNTEKQCGDLVFIHFKTSVPKNAFKSANATTPFKRSLYVRSYPGSFGIQYGYDSRETVLDSFDNKEFVYFTGRLAFGEIKSEIVQLTSYDDEVDHINEDYYQSTATIDYSNMNYNLSSIAHDRVYFDSYLYVYADSFVLQYQTVQNEGVLDVFAAIGGMRSTFSSPITFVIALWLYGMSIGFLVVEGKAPLDPLPKDFLKRLDVYLAEKVLSHELLGGPAWASMNPEHVPGSSETPGTRA